MNIKFRNLRADEIEIRIGMVKQQGTSLLLYKSSRCDQKILDEIVGPMNWQRSHEIIGGNLYCTVSIYDSEKQEWIGKQDVGTEAFMEKEKSICSDAYKRACVNWGIGRELYSSPDIFFYANNLKTLKQENGKWKCYDKFQVMDIEYDEHDKIASVLIKNLSTGNSLLFGTPLSNQTPLPQPQAVKQEVNSNQNLQREDNELNSLISPQSKERLLANCQKDHIDLEALLLLYRVDSVDQLTNKQYQNMIKHWGRILADYNT